MKLINIICKYLHFQYIQYWVQNYIVRSSNTIYKCLYYQFNSTAEKLSSHDIKNLKRILFQFRYKSVYVTICLWLSKYPFVLPVSCSQEQTYVVYFVPFFFTTNLLSIWCLPLVFMDAIHEGRYPVFSLSMFSENIIIFLDNFLAQYTV